MDGLRRLTLTNRALRVQVLPELGGKIASLVRCNGESEFLLQAEDVGRSYRAAGYQSPFDQFDTSGFDECVPTVAACRYPDGSFSNAQLPDHGELWSARWESEIDGDGLKMRVQGRALPYRFERRMRLEGEDLVLDYSLTNLSKEPLLYLWSAHPLLRPEVGALICLPVEVKSLLVNWSKGGRLGAPGSECRWPLSRTGDALNVLGPPSLGHADKLFTAKLGRVECGMYYPRRDESIVFRVESGDVHYIGLWICQGGWPEQGQPHYTLALEPCNGRPDSLADAAARGECRRIEPEARDEWRLRLLLRAGRPALKSNSED